MGEDKSELAPFSASLKFGRAYEMYQALSKLYLQRYFTFGNYLC